jgi:hypothetical protein
MQTLARVTDDLVLRRLVADAAVMRLRQFQRRLRRRFLGFLRGFTAYLSAPQRIHFIGVVLCRVVTPQGAQYRGSLG